MESCLVHLTVGTSDWGNSFSMPLVLGKMPKVCPVATQVIAFKNDGVLCLLLGVFIPLQDIQIIYELFYMHAIIGFQPPGTECMLVLVVVDIYFCLMLTLRSVGNHQ